MCENVLCFFHNTDVDIYKYIYMYTIIYKKPLNMHMHTLSLPSTPPQSLKCQAFSRESQVGENGGKLRQEWNTTSHSGVFTFLNLPQVALKTRAQKKLWSIDPTLQWQFCEKKNKKYYQDPPVNSGPHLCPTIL